MSGVRRVGVDIAPGKVWWTAMKTPARVIKVENATRPIRIGIDHDRGAGSRSAQHRRRRLHLLLVVATAGGRDADD